MQIQPYLFFNGRCEEAVAFYRQALGAEVEMMLRFKDSPEPLAPGAAAPDLADKVMHVSLRIGGALLMASDGMGAGELAFQGFSLSIDAPDTAGADRMFNALAEGGTVKMPIGKTFWSPYFGIVADRFGVSWMVTLTA